LAALILLNAPVWFRDPFSIRQLLSWLLGAASIALAIEGFRLLRVLGQPSRADAQGSNFAFENTTALVTAGVYRFIRHPMYASLLALAGCAYLKDPARGASILFALAAAVFLIATALAEERENLARFGDAYLGYMKRTRRFVPFFL
jgi:protein-S-isoprenylcysteine O-methyltransferase Ste14